jgi:hypothetical protein
LSEIGPTTAFYGDKTTILAALYTDQPTVTRMYYRKFGELDFNFVTLDGFTTNNQFVKYLHYGFIPKQLVEQNSAYEIYFEAENLVGLKTVVKNNGQNFLLLQIMKLSTQQKYNFHFHSQQEVFIRIL